MNICFGDFETFCDVPISHGTHRYAEAVEITVGGYATNDGAVVVDDYTGGADPARMIDTMERADLIVFHNLSFDRTVARHAWGYDIPLHKCVDTMVLALAHSLPGSLGKLCDVLQIPTDKAKDKDGKRLINLFCKPRPAKQKLRRATRETHPEEWQKFLDYAKLDIEAMRAVYKRLPKWNWTAAERELWLLDQKINDRGVQIDLDLVEAAIAAVDEEQAALAEQTQELTGGFVTSALQRDAMLRHILEAYEVPMEDLRGVTIEKMLENDNYPPELLELLRVRLKASTTSTAKYKALQKATSSDGRLRGTLQFCGASRTGRAAGRLVQLQNLPRPTLKSEIIEGGIDLIKAGAASLAGDVMELTSNAVRGCIVAPPGKKLVVADLSNIEGRVLAWLAGEEWKLQAFRDFDAGTGHDLYKLAYARTFRVTPEDVTKGQRQVGKVLELAMGFEGGVGAFTTFAAAYNIDLDEMAEKARPSLGAGLIAEAEELYAWGVEQKRPTFGLSRDTWVTIDAIKRAWRYAHPMISTLWKDLQQSVIRAHEFPGQVLHTACGKVQVVRHGAWLKIIMPSGRALSYPAVRVEDGKISYLGVNQYTRQWGRTGTYGGKLAENGTQFTARDVFFSSMIPVEAAGYEIITHVHDELICQAPDSHEFNAEHLAGIMSTNPDWATGLPLAAAGFECARYRKDD